MKKVLWIAPNLNHYKARLLKRLGQSGELDVTVLAGARVRQLGYESSEAEWTGLKAIRLEVPKANFHLSSKVYRQLFSLIRTEKFDVVLMPSEKKHLPLIIVLYVLKKIYGFLLVTYTHPLMRSRELRHQRLNRFMTKSVFRLYDRVILYTEHAMLRVIREGLIPKQKAVYANNTLDTESINRISEYIPPPHEPRMLFIGRLIPSKRIDLLLEYFRALKKEIPNLKLTIIGDGPEAQQVSVAAREETDIEWKGAIIDEEMIAGIMRNTRLVFLPGLAGLTIVHAFCYGRPFVTLANKNHGPEIAYLEDGKTGLILKGDLRQDVARLKGLMGDREILESYCRSAYEKSKEISIGHWCEQMIRAMTAKKLDETAGVKPKVILIQNVIVPYRLRLYEMLAANRNLDFKIILTTKNCHHRPHWNHFKDEVRAPVKIASSLKVFFLSMKTKRHNKFLYFPYALYHELLHEDADVVICGGFSFSTVIAYLYKKLHGKKVIIWLESNRYTDANPGMIRASIRGFLSRRTDAFIGSSAMSREYLIDSLGLPSNGPFFTAYTCVDYQKFDRGPLNGENGQKTILYVGRFDENKNVRTLASVYRRLVHEAGMRDVSLVMVGEGPLTREIDLYAKEQDLPGLKLVSQESYDKVVEYYKKSSLFSLLSYTDAGPIVISEAIGACLPIVCSRRAGGGKDFICDGINGYLVEPDDENTILQKIQTVLNWDEKQIQRCRVYCEEMRRKASYENAHDVFVDAIQYSLSNTN